MLHHVLCLLPRPAAPTFLGVCGVVLNHTFPLLKAPCASGMLSSGTYMLLPMAQTNWPWDAMPYPKATDLAWRGASCTTAGARCFASGAHSTALTHFELLGVPHQTFSLDSAELEQKYRALQFRLHPDKAASGSKEAQKDSAEQSTLVNQAYAVLKSPLKRALYLLELRGALNDLGGEHTVEDMELLQRVMEVREQVEAAAHEGELASLRQENRQEEKKCVQALAEAFKRDDLVEAATLAKQLRYITRIGEAIRDKS